MRLIALRPVLYHAHQYDTGDDLPVNDPEMAKLWVEAETAIWKEETEPERQTAKATPATAIPGMAGMSSEGTTDLVGRIPETTVRRTAKAGTKTRSKTGATKRKTQ